MPLKENRKIKLLDTVGSIQAVGSLELKEGKLYLARLEVGLGKTDIFIRPPYEFQVIDALVTNFHLPRSTLLMLVAGFETMRAAYDQALEHDYRFFSLGDAMFIQ